MIYNKDTNRKPHQLEELILSLDTPKGVSGEAQIQHRVSSFNLQ